MSTRKSARPSHCCECICLTCERTNAGYFAQRAALQNDRSVIQNINPKIWMFLRAQRLVFMRIRKAAKMPS